MKPDWYGYEAEEYDLDNEYNEEEDRRDEGRDSTLYDVIQYA